MTEYGRIHTDGSRSGGQPVQSDAERVARALAQADGIEICSDATYALSSYGHKAQAALAAMHQSTQSDALCEEIENLLHDLERQMTIANEHVNEAERLRRALAHIAFSGANGPYGEFGEALNEHQMRRVARAALQEQNK